MNPVSVNRLGTKTAALRSSLAPDIGNIILLRVVVKLLIYNKSIM